MMSFNFISNFLTNNTDISVLFLMHLIVNQLFYSIITFVIIKKLIIIFNKK